jgi:hypothetical protein
MGFQKDLKTKELGIPPIHPHFTMYNVEEGLPWAAKKQRSFLGEEKRVSCVRPCS